MNLSVGNHDINNSELAALKKRVADLEYELRYRKALTNVITSKAMYVIGCANDEYKTDLHFGWGLTKLRGLIKKHKIDNYADFR